MSTLSRLFARVFRTGNSKGGKSGVFADFDDRAARYGKARSGDRTGANPFVGSLFTNRYTTTVRTISPLTLLFIPGVFLLLLGVLVVMAPRFFLIAIAAVFVFFGALFSIAAWKILRWKKNFEQLAKNLNAEGFKPAGVQATVLFSEILSQAGRRGGSRTGATIDPNHTHSNASSVNGSSTTTTTRRFTEVIDGGVIDENDPDFKTKIIFH